MADPTDTLATNIQYVGRGLLAEAKTGMNGGLNPSAIQTNGLDFQGKPLPRGTVAKSILAANKAQLAKNCADQPDWQSRKISAKPISATPGMKSPDSSAKVPTSLNRGTVAPSVKPAPRGNFKR
jgi:hypothetical protein